MSRSGVVYICIFVRMHTAKKCWPRSPRPRLLQITSPNRTLLKPVRLRQDLLSCYSVPVKKMIFLKKPTRPIPPTRCPMAVRRHIVLASTAAATRRRRQHRNEAEPRQGKNQTSEPTAEESTLRTDTHPAPP